jgi:RNA polymerase sigma factor (sigma-70 family)
MDAARREPELEALLRESAWVRGLARGLLGEGAAADDLAQDVLVAALDRRPGLEGARLRGWLRTVARRLALRARERGGLRARAERESSRRDDADRDSERRLELQRELTAALGELEPADRTVLVLRYFDGLSTGDLARHLEIAEPAARKRLSRALERLRERLDARSGGDRRAWSAALIGALAPRAGEALPPALPIATLLVGFMSKTTFTVAALGAACLWLALSRPWVAPRPAAADAVAAVESTDAAPQPPHDAPTQAVATVAAGARLALDFENASTPAPEARVRVVDALGATVVGARAAWLDAAGVFTALEFGADGSAPRPEHSQDARFFALAEGHGCGLARAGAPGEDVVVVLPATRTVTGRVIEDGEVPRQPLRLRLGTLSVLPGISTADYDYSAALRALEVEAAGRVVITEPDGSFRLEGVAAETGSDLGLPTTHRMLAVNGQPVPGGPYVSISSETTELRIEAARLPSIFGRMVWDDTGEPLQGSIGVVYRSRRAVNDMMTGDWLDEQGRFAIGIPVDARVLSEPFESRAAGLTERSIRLRPEGIDNVPLPFEHAVDLTDAAFPLDVGTVRVPRTPVLHLRLIGPGGAPIEGAAVASDLARASSDAQGRVRIAASEGPLRVLAVDCALTEFPLPVEPTSAESPLAVRLAPGATLEVITQRGEGPNPWAGRSIAVAWAESPFEGAPFDGPGGPEPLASRLYRVLFGRRFKDVGWRNNAEMPGKASFVVPANGALLVPGWRMGATASIEVLDGVDQPLAELELRVPGEPRRFTVDLTRLSFDAGGLRLRAVDADGRTQPRATFQVRAQGEEHTEYLRVDGSSLDLRPLRLGRYDVTVLVLGFQEQRLEGLEATPDAPERTVVLAAARTLSVALVDEAGQTLRAASVEVRDASRVDRGESGTWSPNRMMDELVGSASVGRLPLVPLELAVVVGTRTWTRDVDAEQTSLSLDLPVHGRLALSVEARQLLTGESGNVVVRLRELEGDGALEEDFWVTSGGVGPTEATFDLLPGRYALEVDLREYPEGAQESDEPLVRPLDRREVEVRAQERTEVAIRP